MLIDIKNVRMTIVWNNWCTSLLDKNTKKNTLALILTSLPGQFQDIQPPGKLSDHLIVKEAFRLALPQKTNSEKAVFIPER